MDAARSTAKTHHSRARAGMQNMVTGAKNPTSTNRPHHSALASRKKPTQTHPCRCQPRKRLYRARFYHAELGRFVSRDPVGYVDGINLYRGYFVPGGTDPEGLITVRCHCYSSWQTGTGPYTNVIECPSTSEARKCCKDSCAPHTLTTFEILFDVKSFCKDTKECCCDDCETKLKELIEYAHSINTRGWVNKCQNYTEDFFSGSYPVSDCYKLQWVAWDYFPYRPLFPVSWRLRHAAIRVTLCNGNVFFLDNGWWGGSERIFTTAGDILTCEKPNHP